MESPPQFTTADGDQLADWFSAQFRDGGVQDAPDEASMALVGDALQAGLQNLLGDHPGTAADWSGGPFGLLEAKTSFRCSLDPDAFQIICKTADSSSEGLDWPRLGISRAGDTTVEPFFSPSMFDRQIDLACDVPDAAAFLNTLTQAGTAVVALLGTARIDANQGVGLIHHVRDVVVGLDNTAFMTGGYRGAFEHSYGVTRAGFDVPKALGRQTIWVMCRAGVHDASQTPDARCIYGFNWGDDTPAMEASSDGAIFFRNIPPGKMYGAWTSVEIANFVTAGKPLAIVDPTAERDHERLFGQDVNVFRSGAGAAHHLAGQLDATVDQRKSRKPFVIDGLTMRTLQRGRLDDDIQMVHITGENDSFHALYVPVVPTAEVQQAFAGAGIAVPDEGPDRWQFMRGFWQDVMMMEVAGLITLDRGTTRAEILALPTAATITAYARYRDAVADALSSGGSPLFFHPPPQ